MKYKVGDRVRVISAFDGRNLKGKMGTVVESGKSCKPYEIGVAFDEPFPGGHTCGGNAADGHGRYGNEKDLVLVDENRKIVITSDGIETLARLYEGNKVVKSATAKCSPDDTYNFEEGARIAYDRLMGVNAVKEEKPKYFNGKAVCVEKSASYMSYTIGKVYEFKDGRVKIDNGNIIPSTEQKGVESLAEWNNSYFAYAKFIPLVE